MAKKLKLRQATGFVFGFSGIEGFLEPNTGHLEPSLGDAGFCRAQKHFNNIKASIEFSLGKVLSGEQCRIGENHCICSGLADQRHTNRRPGFVRNLLPLRRLKQAGGGVGVVDGA